MGTNACLGSGGLIPNVLIIRGDCRAFSRRRASVLFYARMYVSSSTVDRRWATVYILLDLSRESGYLVGLMHCVGVRLEGSDSCTRCQPFKIVSQRRLTSIASTPRPLPVWLV